MGNSHGISLEEISVFFCCSYSLYTVAVYDANIHCTKREPDYFSIKPRFEYLEFTEKFKMAAS